MVKLPVNRIEKYYNKNSRGSRETIICYAYEKDLNQLYDFYCARYKNITYDEFLKLGINEVNRKLESIPESEPLHKIIKARTINIAKIKDKEEKKYWRELKEIHKIPSIYLTDNELDFKIKGKLGGLKHER